MATKEHVREWRRNRLYGMEPGAYDKLFKEQGGVCGICRKPEGETNRGVLKVLQVDHNHNTGRVRGLLCGRCNRTVGLLESMGPKHVLTAIRWISCTQ